MNFSSEDTILAEKAQSKAKLEQKVPFDLSVQLTMQSSSDCKFVDVTFEDTIIKKKSALSQFSTLFAVNVIPGVKYFMRKELEDLRNLKIATKS